MYHQGAETILLPTRPRTLILLSQGILFTCVPYNNYDFYHHCIRKVQTGWCDPLVLHTAHKGQVLGTSSRGGQSLEKQHRNNHLGENDITHRHLGQLTKVHLVIWPGMYLQEPLGLRPRICLVPNQEVSISTYMICLVLVTKKLSGPRPEYPSFECLAPIRGQHLHVEKI